jgi:hypothetical protein
MWGMGSSIGLDEFSDLLRRNQDPIGDSPRCQPHICDHVIHSANADGEDCSSFSAADQHLPVGGRCHFRASRPRPAAQKLTEAGMKTSTLQKHLARGEQPDAGEKRL